MDIQINIVDERFELLSLIFKLAGHRPEYNDKVTEYQNELINVFSKFSKHPTINLIKNYQLGYDIVFVLALHMEKENRIISITKNIEPLLSNDRWDMNQSDTNALIKICSDFYVDTNFNQFFDSHIPYFQEITKKFNDDWYRHIDLEWFRKYIDPSNLYCIVSPSDSRHNYAATVNERAYCLVRESGGQIIHEYCHSFANPIAYKWYNENEQFKKWCDDSINPEKLPSYRSGLGIAYEYVTTAYTVLHYCQSKSNGVFYNVKKIAYRWNEAAPLLMLGIYQRGFKYIQEVYDMVLKFESEGK